MTEEEKRVKMQAARMRTHEASKRVEELEDEAAEAGMEPNPFRSRELQKKIGVAAEEFRAALHEQGRIYDECGYNLV